MSMSRLEFKANSWVIDINLVTYLDQMPEEKIQIKQQQWAKMILYIPQYIKNCIRISCQSLPFHCFSFQLLPFLLFSLHFIFEFIDTTKYAFTYYEMQFFNNHSKEKSACCKHYHGFIWRKINFTFICTQRKKNKDSFQFSICVRDSYHFQLILQNNNYWESEKNDIKNFIGKWEIRTKNYFENYWPFVGMYYVV